jgi:hypothetical protein
MTTTTTTDAINWDAAAELADALGRRTLRLVAERNPDAIIDWALEMARSSSMSDYMGTRAASYLELAVLVGHTAPPLPATPADDMRLEWIGAKLTALTGELREVRKLADKVAADLAAASSDGQEAGESEEVTPDE